MIELNFAVDDAGGSIYQLDIFVFQGLKILEIYLAPNSYASQRMNNEQA